jgi:glycosyltransferase involved in cell wall biosynthesis
VSDERPLNVLHTLRSLRVDGVTKVVLRNVAELDHARFRHHVCAMIPELQLAGEFRAAGIEPIVLEHHGGSSIPGSVRRIAALLDELAIDVVHANRTLDLMLAGTAARLRGVPVVSTLHWLGRLEDHPEDRGASLARRAEERTPVLLNRLLADRVVAVSDAVKRSYGALAGFPSERTEVVYPGLHVAGHPPPDAAARAGARAALGLGAEAPVLLNVGRLEPVKGQRHLVPMMRRLRERLPEAVLLVAGAGDLHDVLARQIGEADLGGAIHLLGSRDDVDALLAASDLLMLASESEAAPLPLFEAMRAARPVVATDVGGVPEIVLDGETGLVVPRGDARAMADAALRILTTPGEGERMGGAGRRLAEERFDIARSLCALERIYREVAAARPRRARATHARRPGSPSAGSRARS